MAGMAVGCFVTGDKCFPVIGCCPGYRCSKHAGHRCVEDGNWLGLREEDLEEFEEESKIEVEGSDKGERDSEKEKFEAWKNQAEALIELREAQEGIKNEENRNWDYWLVFYEGNGAAKFLVVLIIVPWAMDFLVHDYVLMPFLD
uniref:Uncharacterized protein n=1 Tax=Chenopodium quinoa TaxID=63459 RepID=A0A803ND94_CHEQI